jgi:hypothetical protein
MSPVDSPLNPSLSRVDAVWRVVTIGAVALFLLLGAILSFRHQGGVVFPDEQDYYRLAENLVKYRMFTWDGVAPTASRPPGFVFWLAIWKSLGLGWGMMVWLNSVIVAIALWLLANAWFARENLAAGRAAIFGLLFAYPVTVYVFSTLYPQAFCLALIATSLALMIRRGGWVSAVFAGFLMGWCALAAPIYATWGGVLALVPLFRRRLDGLGAAILFSIVFGAVIVSWGVRNAAMMGRFVPFSTNSGFNLLLGNCETTRPNAGLNIDISKYAEEVTSRKLGETETDAFYAAAAKKWIADHPAQAVSMYFQKLLNYFNYRNELVTTSAASPTRDALMFVTYYALLVVLMVRLITAWPSGRPRWQDWLVVGGYLACAMFTSIATTRIRYRIPNDVLLFFVVAPVVAGVARQAVERLLSARAVPGFERTPKP